MTDKEIEKYTEDTLELNSLMEALTIAAKAYKEKWKSHFEGKDFDPYDILGEETVKECERVQELFNEMMYKD